MSDWMDTVGPWHRSTWVPACIAGYDCSPGDCDCEPSGRQTERGRLPQAGVAPVAVDARPRQRGNMRDDARPLPAEPLAAPLAVCDRNCP